MSDKVRVLIVDDSAFMRSVLTRLISASDDFEIVGTGVNGQEAVDKVKELKPDVVTLDIEMPVKTGIEALSEIVSSDNPVPCVMISSLTEEGAQATLEALELGAVDFIPKALGDASRNILRQAGIIQEKLKAAVSVRKRHMRPTTPVRAPSAATSQAPASPATPARPEAKAAPRLTTETPTPVQKRLSTKTGRPKSPKIIVVGSSTGGPKALQEFIPFLPANLSVPVVVAQHMPANFTGPMANRLNAKSGLNVQEAQHGDVLKPGNVYIAQGGKHLRVVQKSGQYILSIDEDNGESHYMPSVSVLAKSVSDVLGGDAIAVMLTGMGTDGADGFTELKGKGAYIIAQDEQTSVVYGMPKAVAEACKVNEILPLNEIAQAVVDVL